ncbi:MAG: hypothetical protein M3256_14320, partial [Actinomycetota bacterium]|nr:hypothetical protein [Actinomycetota bacterium]
MAGLGREDRATDPRRPWCWRPGRPVPGGPRTYTWEVTEFKPDRRWAFRGIDEPVRAYLSMTLTTLDGGGGAGTRVPAELDF